MNSDHGAMIPACCHFECFSDIFKFASGSTLNLCHFADFYADSTPNRPPNDLNPNHHGTASAVRSKPQMATLKDLQSAPPVPVKRRSQILDAVPSRFRRKTKMSKNAKHKRGAQSNKFFGRESKAKYLKKRKPFKTNLSSEHGATSESKANAHALSSNDVLQLSASSQSPAASGPSVQSLSAH